MTACNIVTHHHRLARRMNDEINVSLVLIDVVKIERHYENKVGNNPTLNLTVRNVSTEILDSALFLAFHRQISTDTVRQHFSKAHP